VAVNQYLTVSVGVSRVSRVRVKVRVSTIQLRGTMHNNTVLNDIVIQYMIKCNTGTLCFTVVRLKRTSKYCPP